MTRNASRQPHARSRISSGTVTAIAPTAPAENAIPFMVARRSGGYHSTKAVSAAIRQADTPRPISARAAIASAARAGGGEPHAARRGDEEQRRVDAPRAEAVERDADRKLEQGEGEEVDAREQPEAGGGEAELGGERRREHRVHHPVHVRDEVAREERQG